jgi:hypothetical protein
MQTQTQAKTQKKERLGTARVRTAAQTAIADAETPHNAVDNFVAELWRDDSLLKTFIAEKINGLAAQYLNTNFGEQMAGLSAAPKLVSFTANGTRRNLAVMQQASQSILDHHITTLGIALGDCTKDNLETLAKENQRRAQFYQGLSIPLPPGGKVREHYKAEEVQVAYDSTMKAR